MIDDDPLSPERLRDPYPYFAELRENDPVHWNEQYRAWFIHRHDDALLAIKDPERFSSDRIWPVFDNKLTSDQRDERREIYDILGRWMVFRDPPDHTRLRRLVSREFSRNSIERWRPRVEEIVADLLKEVMEREQIDLIRDFAFALPAVVIAEMLGVPSSDRDLFKKWSDDIMILIFGARGLDGRQERAQQGLAEMEAYLEELVRKYRVAPAENLISALVAAQDGGDVLSNDEITSNCILFLFGGHETTTNLIGNGMRALMNDPEQYGLLRSNPMNIRNSIEELLRFDGPSKMEIRMAAADIELRDKIIRSGDMVHVVQAAANRDPAVFDRPDRLDLNRDTSAHIGFGFGIHFCLGAPLARLEGSVAISALVNAFGAIEPDGDEQWIPTMVSRGMQSFPIRFKVDQSLR